MPQPAARETRGTHRDPVGHRNHAFQKEFNQTFRVRLRKVLDDFAVNGTWTSLTIGDWVARKDEDGLAIARELHQMAARVLSRTLLKRPGIAGGSQT